MMKHSLFDKIIVLYVVIGTLCFLAMIAFTSHNITSILISERTASLESQAQLVTKQYIKKYFTKETSSSALQEQLVNIKQLLKTEIWIFDTNGQIIAASSERARRKIVNIRNLAPELSLDTSFSEMGNFHHTFSNEMLSIGIPIVASSEPKGFIILHSDMSNLADIKSNILQIIYLAYMLVMLFSLYFLYHFTRKIINPIDQINKIAINYSNGEFDTPLNIKDNNEIGQLADSLNNMAAEIQKSEQYRKNFIANISHDFRSPLTSIKGYVEAILDGTIPPEKQDRYLNIVLSETSRLSKLTNELLTLNSFNTKLVIKKKTFDINHMVRQILEMFEGQTNAKQIQVIADIADEPLLVYADSEKIKQVVYNLLDNAIKFSQNDSTIIVTILATKGSNKVTVSVKDEGIGISANDQKHIFERFFKADSSRGKDKTGTGLGLAIVKEIIKAHNETITLNSAPGKGCNFTFTLTKAS